VAGYRRGLRLPGRVVVGSLDAQVEIVPTDLTDSDTGMRWYRD